MRVVIAGASGLIGSALAADLRAGGADVLRLVRAAPASPEEVSWDPSTGKLDPAVLSGADAVVSLSGAPIAGGRWTDARKAVLRDSRISSTTALVSAMRAADSPPAVFVSGSAIGYYGDTGDQIVDESAPRGAGFLAGLVEDWEAAAQQAAGAGVRVATIRTGIVLAARGGMLGQLTLPFKLGLGAKVGSGSQYMSWISLTDEVRAIRFVIGSAGLAGPVNLTAPQPATNAEFTRALASALGRPAMLSVPSPLLRGVLGELASELLASARVAPAKLLAAGFEFSYPRIGPALAAILGSAT